MLLVSCGSDMNPYFGYKSIGYKKKLSKTIWRAYNVEQKSGEWIQKDLDWIYIVKFNEAGNIVEAGSYDENSKLKSMQKMVYLKDDRVKSIFYDSDGEITGETIFELEADDKYNFKDGYVLFSHNYGKDYRLIHQNYKFVGDSSLLEYESITKGEFRYQKYYDQNQELVYLTTSEFIEFNNHGDWLKAMRYDEGEGDKLVHLIIRELVYIH